MSINMETIRKQFFIEARDILEKVTDDILIAEVDYTNQDLLNSIFRGIHTIKGNAGTIGLGLISEFSHHLENLLQKIRGGDIQLNSEIVDVILSSTDFIKTMFNEYEMDKKPEIDQSLCDKIKSFLPKETSEKNGHANAAALTHNSSMDKLRSSSTVIPEAIINTLIEHHVSGANIFQININYTDALLSNGYDQHSLLKNIKNKSIFYYAITDQSKLPGIADIMPLKLYLHPVLYIATYESMDSLIQLSVAPELIEITDLKNTVTGKLISFEKVDSSILKEFTISTNELFESAEALILGYEKNDTKESLNEIFRIIHTIKGDSNYIGFEDLSKYAHSLETLLFGLKNSTIKRTARTTDLILQAIDGFKKIVFMLESGAQYIQIPQVFIDIENEILKIDSTLSNAIVESESKPLPQTLFTAFIQQMVQYKENILINLKTTPLDNYNIENIERILNSINLIAKKMKLKPLETLTDDAFNCIKNSSPEELFEAVDKIFIYMDGINYGPKKIGELLIEEGIITEMDLSAALSQQKPIGEILLETGKISKDSLDEVLKKQEIMKDGWNSKPETIGDIAGIKTLRIDERKIENFSNVIGEFLVAKNTYEYILNQINADTGISSSTKKLLKDNLHSFSRLTSEIQLSVMSLRMVPLKGVFQKFLRVVRDISRKQNKQIELIMIGDDIEIDKKVADKLSDPLIHLVRNSCDHGIETVADRLKASKPEKGTITLKAAQEGRNIIIKIIDDGKGMNRQMIYDKAIKMGINVQSPMDKNLFDVIFLPGFSTNEEITDISGRGVGMDVVSATIKSLGGTVYCESQEGKGSEITLIIPMAMGVSVALIVEADNNDYAIPFENVIEVIKIAPELIMRLHDRKGIIYRNESLPIEYLQKLLFDSGIEKKSDYNQYRKTGNEEVIIAILQTHNGKLGVIVDSLKNNMQISIKPVPEQLAGISVINGVSITGDGRVMLVLNPNKLIK